MRVQGEEPLGADSEKPLGVSEDLGVDEWVEVCEVKPPFVDSLKGINDLFIELLKKDLRTNKTHA
jgi:hypothetical protein